MADQFANGLEAERLGVGLHIPFLELSEQKLFESLKTLLDEPAYTDKAKTLGSALVDQVCYSLIVYEKWQMVFFPNTSKLMSWVNAIK